jgi:8-oxo-dGTP pyrophosphatase MutT (NUDIX family)
MTAPDEQENILATVWRQVAGRSPVDGREVRSRDRILVAFGRLADPLDLRADPTHVTGSALLCGPRGIVLLRHKRLGILVQPGGHLDPGEAPWEAARREGEEETGMRLRFGGAGPSGYPPAVPRLAHVDVHAGGRGHTHLDLRYVLEPIGSDTPSPPAGESQEVRWYDWEEAAEVADPGLAGYIRARLRGCIGG